MTDHTTGQGQTTSNPRERFPILEFFTYAHLPAPLQTVSKPYCELAESLASSGSTAHAEVAAGLRYLLCAKDCAVRAALKTPKPED